MSGPSGPGDPGSPPDDEDVAPAAERRRETRTDLRRFSESESANLCEILDADLTAEPGNLTPEPRDVAPDPRADAVGVEWRSELESGLDAIDSRLVRRRRAPHVWVESGPGVDQGGRDLPLTPEVLEDLASRVAERLRAAGPSPAHGLVSDPTVTPPVRREADSDPHRANRMKNGAVVSIQVRWPLFSLRRFRSLRRHRLSA